MVKAMDCGIVVREFVLQSRYYVHFRTNTLGKSMNALILPAMGYAIKQRNQTKPNHEHPNYSIIKIGQNTEKRKLTVTQTPVEDHQLTLLLVAELLLSLDEPYHCDLKSNTQKSLQKTYIEYISSLPPHPWSLIKNRWNSIYIYIYILITEIVLYFYQCSCPRG